MLVLVHPFQCYVTLWDTVRFIWYYLYLNLCFLYKIVDIIALLVSSAFPCTLMKLSNS